MATNVDCPSCEQKLRVPDDLLGKKVKCPSCKTMFTATANGLQSQPVEREAPPIRASALSESKHDDLPSKRPRDDGDEEEDEDRPRRKPERSIRKSRRSRENYAPHKGVIILVMGIIGLVTFPILCPVAWIMGNIDMKEIREGRMDPEGESMTNIGRILGIVGTILHGIGLVIACVIFVIYLIFIVAIFGAVAGAGAGAR